MRRPELDMAKTPLPLSATTQQLQLQMCPSTAPVTPPSLRACATCLSGQRLESLRLA